MAHKTLIDGTAHEIIGGKTLIDGTIHNIKSGKTLVGGTVHDLVFIKTVTVTIGTEGGTSNPANAYVIIDGQTYDGSTEHTLTVPVGTVATCYANNNVSVNGAYVGSENRVTYEHEITANTYFNIMHNQLVGWVVITEE